MRSGRTLAEDRAFGDTAAPPAISLGVVMSGVRRPIRTKQFLVIYIHLRHGDEAAADWVCAAHAVVFDPVVDDRERVARADAKCRGGPGPATRRGSAASSR